MMFIMYLFIVVMADTSIPAVNQGNMNINFKNKRVLVTGAGSGIGKGIALQLSKGGAKVLALDISNISLENLKSEISDVELIQVDLNDWKATEVAIKKVFPIDLLVNNAGIGVIDPITDVTEEKYERQFGVNIKALINVSRIFVQNFMTRKSPGAIVNISSQASQSGLLHHTLYCATKGAVDAFTRALALELGPQNIRVNCVNPTVVMTDLGRRVWSDPNVGGPMLAKIPLNRFAEVEDVVSAVLFLLSDEAKMINGHCLPVDGGFLAA